MKMDCLSENHKGTDCLYRPITCSEGFCQDCQIYKDYRGYERTMGRLHGSITPRWLEEQEKEQNDKLEILKKQIDIRRDNAFSESLFGSLEHQLKTDAMVNTYDVVLNLIKEMVK